MPLSDVRHQAPAQKLIQRALASARVPHAYIFHGPDGAGKEMFARRFAALLLCEKPIALGTNHSDACGQCQSCRLVAADTHPDLHIVHRRLKEFHPDSDVRKLKAIDLSIDVVRHFLIGVAGIAPAMGRAKVFIVRDADTLNVNSQNALLKTLEEPPPATFITLLVSTLDELLPTTRSRCQLVEFGPLPTAFIAEQLQARREGLSAADARWYAAVAQGSLSAALRFAEDDLAAFNRALSAAIGTLSRKTASSAAKLILDYSKESSARFRKRDAELSDTAAQRGALRDVFALLATWYRDRLHFAAGTTELAAGAPAEDADRLAPGAAAHAVEVIAATEAQLDQNVNVQLCIEGLMFRLAALDELPAAALL